jgi:zinc transporter 5/7
VLFTHLCSILTKAILEPATARKAIAVSLSVGLSLLSDITTTRGDFRTILPAYVALVAHALSSSGLQHTQGVLSPALGSTFTTAASTLGACLLFLPLYMFRQVLVSLAFLFFQ